MVYHANNPLGIVTMAQANRTNHPLAARVFLQHYDEFKTSVRDVRSLADELHSRGLVSEVTLQNVHSRNLARSTQWLSKQLFLATHQELCINPRKFAAMLEALKSDNALKTLCKQMELTGGRIWWSHFLYFVGLYLPLCKLSPGQHAIQQLLQLYSWIVLTSLVI